VGALCALGERARVEGFGLIGATVLVADDSAGAGAAWRGLPPDAEIVVLTPAAATVLGALVDAPDAPLSVVMPS
jgi:vacuolar-type H+-ATPase subunit F/Vma7